MAYLTASIQVDADMTKGHSPGYLGYESNVFPALLMWWYISCLDNKRGTSSGEKTLRCPSVMTM